MQEKIESWLNEHKQQIIDELTDWVAIRSVSKPGEAAPGEPFGPECAAMLDHALKSAQAKGFAVENHEGYAGSVYLGDQPDQIGIVAHLDVVPEGNGWIYQPFSAQLIDNTDENSGYLVGRGTSDNKGMGVMGLYALMCLRDLEIPLKHSVRLLLGTSEENGMEDMKYMAAQCSADPEGHKLPKISLVPDSHFPVCYAQKGRMIVEAVVECGDDILAFEGGNVPNQVADSARAVLSDLEDTTIEELRLDQSVARLESGVMVEAEGKSRHAASPDGSENAIARLACALLDTGTLSPESRVAMRAIRNIMADNYGKALGIDYEDEQSGRLTCVCGMARFNSGRITLTLDCRYPVSFDEGLLRARLCIGMTRLGFAIKRLSLSGTYYMDPGDKLATALRDVYVETTGDTAAENYSMGGGTYSKVLPNAITYGGNCPAQAGPDTVMPAGHGGAHAPDEYISVDALLTAIKVYVNAIVKLDEII